MFDCVQDDNPQLQRALASVGSYTDAMMAAWEYVAAGKTNFKRGVEAAAASHQALVQTNLTMDFFTTLHDAALMSAPNDCGGLLPFGSTEDLYDLFHAAIGVVLLNTSGTITNPDSTYDK